MIIQNVNIMITSWFHDVFAERNDDSALVRSNLIFMAKAITTISLDAEEVKLALAAYIEKKI